MLSSWQHKGVLTAVAAIVIAAAIAAVIVAVRVNRIKERRREDDDKIETSFYN